MQTVIDADEKLVATDFDEKATKAVARFQERNHASMQVQTESQSLMATINRIASDPNMDIEKLNRVVDLYNRINAERARRAFNKAVAGLKAELPTIKKNRTVGFDSKRGGTSTNYKHEDLGEIAKTIDPIISKFGIGYRYELQQNAQTLTVTCVLHHDGGHETRTPLTCNLDTSGNKNSIQGIGSAQTYLERYTLKAALGLAVSNDPADDDGQATEKTSDEPKFISAEQVQEVQDLLIETGSDPVKFLAFAKLPSLNEMYAGKFDEAVRIIKQTAARRAK